MVSRVLFSDPVKTGGGSVARISLRSTRAAPCSLGLSPQTFPTVLSGNRMGLRRKRTQLQEVAMITAIVRFRLPQGTTRDDVKAMFEKSAPNYRGIPGLVRKYYLYGDDQTGGGVYLWSSRDARSSAPTQCRFKWISLLAQQFRGQWPGMTRSSISPPICPQACACSFQAPGPRTIASGGSRQPTWWTQRSREAPRGSSRNRSPRPIPTAAKHGSTSERR